MKKNILYTILFLISANFYMPVFGQEMLKEDIKTGFTPDDEKSFTLKKFTRFHLFDSIYKGKKFFYVKCMVSTDDLNYPMIKKGAILYTEQRDTMGQMLVDYEGPMMYVYEKSIDSMFQIGLYGYAPEKVIEPRSIIEDRFVELVKSKKKKYRMTLDAIKVDFGFFEGYLNDSAYFISLCYETYTFNNYPSDYRLIMVCDFDSAIVAYIDKKNIIDLKEKSRNQIDEYTIHYLKNLSEEDHKKIEGALKEYYIK